MAEAFIFLRGASFGLLVLMCLRLLFAYRHNLTGRLMLALCVGLGAYSVAPLLDSAPAWQHISVLIAITIPASFWLFSRALFSDSADNSRQPSLPTVLGIVAFVSISFASYWLHSVMADDSHESSNALLLFYISYAIRMTYIVLALAVIVAHWRQDLVESRRRLRLFVIATTGVYILGVAFIELLLGVESAPLTIELPGAILMLTMLLVANFWLAQSDPDTLSATLGINTAVAESAATTERSLAQQPGAGKEALSLTQTRWLKSLQQYIEGDKGYHTNDLTIRSLSLHLSIPEHLLRRLINQHLGYRNFNDYLNHYRIADAAARLSDQEQERLPILTIALEVGYASLTPFNRAFKAKFDQTPSEYRRGKKNEIV